MDVVSGGTKTLKCYKCCKYKTIDDFSARDVEKKCGVLRIKKGRGNQVACHLCGNGSDKSKRLVAEEVKRVKAAYDEVWFTTNETFDEHCKILGEGGYTPWFGQFKESRGRVFTDRGEVEWDEIIAKCDEYRQAMIARDPERYLKQHWDRYDMYGIARDMPRRGLAPPTMEHGFWKH